MVASSNDPILAQLTADIVAGLPTWFGEGAMLASSPPAWRRLRQSFFVRYVAQKKDGVTVPLLVKIPRKSEIATLAQAVAATHLATPTQQEYDSLVAVAQVFNTGQDARFFAVQPFAYLAQWNAIVMEELPARSLTRFLMRARMALGLPRDWEFLEQALCRAGQWLRVFHERLGDARVQPLRETSLAADLVFELDRLAELSGRQNAFAPMRAACLRAAERLQAVAVPTATLHGDFNCNNTLVMADGRVGVIDTKRRRQGAVYVDLALLAMDPPLRKIQVVTQGAFFRGAWLKRCQTAILTGYFGAQPYDARVFNLCCALMILRKWIADEEALGAAQGARRLMACGVTPLVRRYLRRMLERVLQRTE